VHSAIEALTFRNGGVVAAVHHQKAELGRHESIMPSRRTPPGPPMTLFNMRELGVRSLAVSCNLCHHKAVLSADDWPDTVLVRAFGPRMVCTSCGIIGADARPNWRDMPANGNWRTYQVRMIAMTKSAI